ncbi:MAG: YjbQ family protein [Anaerolineales bacterium]
MTVKTRYITLDTAGNGDVLEITAQVEGCLQDSSLSNGVATIFTPIPPDREYQHNARWGDGNGHSHARAALLKPSLSVPFVNGKLTLGTWQSIVLVDFDNRQRSRKLIVQLMGE